MADSSANPSGAGQSTQSNSDEIDMAQYVAMRDIRLPLTTAAAVAPNPPQVPQLQGQDIGGFTSDSVFIPPVVHRDDPTYQSRELALAAAQDVVTRNAMQRVFPLWPLVQRNADGTIPEVNFDVVMFGHQRPLPAPVLDQTPRLNLQNNAVYATWLNARESAAASVDEGEDGEEEDIVEEETEDAEEEPEQDPVEEGEERAREEEEEEGKDAEALRDDGDSDDGGDSDDAEDDGDDDDDAGTQPALTTNFVPFVVGRAEPERLVIHLRDHRSNYGGAIRTFRYDTPADKIDWNDAAQIGLLTRWKNQIRVRAGDPAHPANPRRTPWPPAMVQWVADLFAQNPNLASQTAYARYQAQFGADARTFPAFDSHCRRKGFL